MNRLLSRIARVLSPRRPATPVNTVPHRSSRNVVEPGTEYQVVRRGDEIFLPIAGGSDCFICALRVPGLTVGQAMTWSSVTEEYSSWRLRARVGLN